MLFKIDFEVDNGTWYQKDTALVIAEDKTQAVEKLIRLINSIDSETCVSKIFNTNIFSGEVFTGQHGWR